MQQAIDEAYKKPNSYAKSVNYKGEKPTVDELFEHIIQKVAKY